MDRFSLAADPDHVPDAVMDDPNTNLRPSTTRSRRCFSRQMLLDKVPQLPRHFEVVDGRRFYDGMLQKDTPPLGLSYGHPIYSGWRLVSQLLGFSDRLQAQEV
jgi:hypothetical protein